MLGEQIASKSTQLETDHVLLSFLFRNERGIFVERLENAVLCRVTLQIYSSKSG